MKNWILKKLGFNQLYIHKYDGRTMVLPTDHPTDNYPDYDFVGYCEQKTIDKIRKLILDSRQLSVKITNMKADINNVLENH